MKKLHQKVYELVGEASMCWSETPSGVFDTERAKLIADKFVLELEKLEKVVDAARNMIGDKSIELKTALRKYDEVVK